uniref:Auxin-responsive protein n=1 Tax=Anthurium amnicola TaxID=1678845 RepID=A0A1D1ZI57_9ARAE
MEGGFGKGVVRAGDPYPRLLDLIPNGRDWMERGGGEGGGGREGYEVAEQKLELRLALPGGEDWSVGKEPKEDPSVLSFGLLPRAPKCATITSAGAKRGFEDTLESKIEGFQQQLPKTSFLHFSSTPGLVRDSSQKANGTDTERQQRQQGLDRKAGSPASATMPSSGNVTASSSSSKARAAAAPVVGWPPIRSFRKNLTSSSSKPTSLPQNGNPGKAEKLEIPSKGMFVKINMDGVPIGRKVDLKAYDSYEKLSSAVDELFRDLLAAQRETPTSKVQNNREAAQAITGLLDGSGEYTLVYEDDEGDKLLVGDVPWDMFVTSVKRLRVLKSSELSALSLAAVSRKKNAPEPGVQ